MRPHHLRLATVDPTYDADSFPETLPKVIFDGESTLSGRFYPVISPYWPRASDRVVMATSGHTYVIIGTLENDANGYFGGNLNVAGRIPGQEIAQTELVADSSNFTTTETTVISVTAPVVAGRTYKIVFSGHGSSDVGTDVIVFRLRDTNATGTERQSDICEVNGSTTLGKSSYMERSLPVTVTEDRTWVVAGVRTAVSSGNCRLEAAGIRPAYLRVIYEGVTAT
jgi:hypothetical protein